MQSSKDAHCFPEAQSVPNALDEYYPPREDFLAGPPLKRFRQMTEIQSSRADHYQIETRPTLRTRNPPKPIDTTNYTQLQVNIKLSEHGLQEEKVRQPSERNQQVEAQLAQDSSQSTTQTTAALLQLKQTIKTEQTPWLPLTPPSLTAMSPNSEASSDSVLSSSTNHETSWSRSKLTRFSSSPPSLMELYRSGDTYDEFKRRVSPIVHSNRSTSNSNMRRTITSSNNAQNSDPAYWEKRKKNNEAAKRSRDNRKLKETEMAVENAYLRGTLAECQFKFKALLNYINRGLRENHFNPEELRNFIETVLHQNI